MVVLLRGFLAILQHHMQLSLQLTSGLKTGVSWRRTQGGAQPLAKIMRYFGG